MLVFVEKFFAHFGKMIDLAVAIDSESILATFRKVSPEILQFWIRFLFGIFLICHCVQKTVSKVYICAVCNEPDVFNMSLICL